MAIKARRIRLRIAKASIFESEPFRYHVVSGFALNRVFGVHGSHHAWTVTHRRSGYSSGTVRSFTLARRLAMALLRITPAKHWQFDDAEYVAQHRDLFIGCKAVRDKFEALT